MKAMPAETRVIMDEMLPRIGRRSSSLRWIIRQDQKRMSDVVREVRRRSFSEGAIAKHDKLILSNICGILVY